MTTTTQMPKRKTTDATLQGEDWHPVVTWIQRCMEIDPDRKPPFLFIDAEQGVAQLLRRTHDLTELDDVQLRLRHDDMEELGTQMRFWEGCQDELKREFRDIAPNSGFFQCCAFAIEDALAETFRHVAD